MQRSISLVGGGGGNGGCGRRVDKMPVGNLKCQTNYDQLGNRVASVFSLSIG